MGYLICDECGGYYELQEGESADYFQSCECGGKLEYVESLEDKKCTKCGTYNKKDAGFCKKCGLELLTKERVNKNSKPVKKTGLYIIIGVICLICLPPVVFTIYNWYEWATYGNFTVENPEPAKWIEYKDDSSGYHFSVNTSSGSPAISAFSLEDYVEFMGNGYSPHYMDVTYESGSLQDVISHEHDSVLGLEDVNKAKIFKDEQISWINREAYEFEFITTDPLGESFSYDRYIFIEDNGGIYTFNLHIGQLKNQKEFDKIRNAMNPDFESLVKSFKRNKS